MLFDIKVYTYIDNKLFIKIYCMCYKRKNEHYPIEKLGKLTKHHLQPRSRGGSNLPNNISYVPEKLHNAYHLMFANHLPHKVAQMLNEHWISRDVTMLVIPNEFVDQITELLSKLSHQKY